MSPALSGFSKARMRERAESERTETEKIPAVQISEVFERILGAESEVERAYIAKLAEGNDPLGIAEDEYPGFTTLAYKKINTGLNNPEKFRELIQVDINKQEGKKQAVLMNEKEGERKEKIAPRRSMETQRAINELYSNTERSLSELTKGLDEALAEENLVIASNYLEYILRSGENANITEYNALKGYLDKAIELKLENRHGGARGAGNALAEIALRGLKITPEMMEKYDAAFGEGEAEEIKERFMGKKM